jgi:hypothetical protein
LSLGGLAFLHLAWYVAAAIVALLAVVIASDRQTCRAYPNGGGAYTVASTNLGRAGGRQRPIGGLRANGRRRRRPRSPRPSQACPNTPCHCLSGSSSLLTAMNLRGVKESGKAFAAPTYGFLLGVHAMFGVAAYRLLFGEQLLAPTAGLTIHAEATAATGWFSATASSCLPSRHRLDRCIRRRRQLDHPALHHRSLRLLHPLPARYRPTLAARTHRQHPHRLPSSDPPLTGDQRHRRHLHRYRLDHRFGHQVHPRSVDRHHRHAAALFHHARHSGATTTG